MITPVIAEEASYRIDDIQYFEGLDNTLCRAYRDQSRRNFLSSYDLLPGYDWLVHLGGQWLSHETTRASKYTAMKWLHPYLSVPATFYETDRYQTNWTDINDNGQGDMFILVRGRGRHGLYTAAATIFLLDYNSNRQADDEIISYLNDPDNDLEEIDILLAFLDEKFDGRRIVTAYYKYGQPYLFALNGQLYRLDDDARALEKFDLDTESFTPICGWHTAKHTYNEDTGLDKLYDILDGFNAQEPVSTRCGGTSQAAHGHSYSIRLRRWSFIEKPWIQPIQHSNYPYPLNPWSQIEYVLFGWQYEALWNFHKFQALQKAIDHSQHLLIQHFKKRFTMDTQAAENLTLSFLNYVIRAHFQFPIPGFPENYNRMNPPVERHIRFRDFNMTDLSQLSPLGQLNAAILEGLEGQDFDDLLQKLVQQGVTDTQYQSGWDLWSSIDHALIMATERPELIEKLIGIGYDIDAPNAFGKTALMYAAQNNRVDSVERLIALGADVNAATYNEPWACTSIVHHQRTALMYAAENASLQIINMLLDAGANTRIHDSQGLGVDDYLTRNRHLEESEKKLVVQRFQKEALQ